MLAAGIDVKVISQSLGHANIGITLDTYAYLLSGIGRTAAKLFDKFLKPCWIVKMSAKEDNSYARLEGFEPTTLGSEVC
jgi:hypothetical protein